MYRKQFSIAVACLMSLFIIMPISYAQTLSPADVLMYIGDAHWISLDDAAVEAETTQSRLQTAGIHSEITEDADYVRQWMLQTTANGSVNVLILYGVIPTTIYPSGNIKRDGSIAENWIETLDGNTILNQADWFGFWGHNQLNDKRVLNHGSALQNIMDIPGITMWGDDNTPMTVTVDGIALTPSLMDFQTDRPFHLDELRGEWFAEKIFASNTGDARARWADPVIVRDGNRGRIAIAYQTYNERNPKGEVAAEIIINYLLDDSLILYFSFDELDGDMAIDHSQYKNHGTLAGAPELVAGKFGNALKFNGQSDWVEVPHADILTVEEAVTVMAWINTERHTGPNGRQYQGILAKGNGPRSYSFYTESPSECLHLSAGGSSSTCTGKVALNEWQHVAVTVEDGTHRYWLNGENVGERGGKNPLPGVADTASVLIGRTHEGNKEFLGLIDEVRIWNRALSEAEIRAEMAIGNVLASVATEEVVAAYSAWDVNEDGRTDVADLLLVVAAMELVNLANPRTDVNRDGTVDAQDIILVAQHLGESTNPAAPASVVLPAGLTSETVQHVLTLLRAASDGSFAFQRGIANLENLLALLVPKETALLANYPNPFNPETWIPYHLATSADVTLRIYAVNGTLVRHLALGHQPAGHYQRRGRAAYWDGKNEQGEPVASGVYFYTLTAGDFTATKKMLIRK